MLPGKLITFEGIDGCGKTTVANLAQSSLLAVNPKPFKVVIESEPTHSAAGALLRDLLRWETNRDLHYTEFMAYLMMADRSRHYWNKMEPMLAQGYHVFCDRYQWSSYAYQSAGGMSLNQLVELNRTTPPPDLVVLFSISPEQAFARIKSTRTHTEMFDNLEILAKIANQYRLLGSGHSGFREIDSTKIVVIDASRPLDKVVVEVTETVGNFLNCRLT